MGSFVLKRHFLLAVRTKSGCFVLKEHFLLAVRTKSGVFCAEEVGDRRFLMLFRRFL